MEKVRGGSVEINIRARTVRIRGEEKQLQPKEYELLRFFLENPGRILPESSCCCGSGAMILEGQQPG